MFDYVKYINKMTEEFIASLRYDYVFNNQHEELPDYLNKESEDKFKSIKRYLTNDSDFKNKYFKDSKKEEKIANEFRIVDIDGNATLFIYKDKDNIFNRCDTYIINDFIEESDYEQRG